jgi:SAM-dependent methyltransferase
VEPGTQPAAAVQSRDHERKAASPVNNETSCHPAPIQNVAYDGRDLEVLATMKRYHRWIVDQFAPFLTGETVEYGAGTGTFSRLILPYVKHLEIVEPSRVLSELLHHEFSREARATIANMPLEKHITSVADETKDTLVLVNVLEHIEDDAAALVHLFRVLRRDGHLLLFVPALRWLFSDLDRYYGHFRRYHRSELMKLVRAAGFDLVTVRYMDLIGVVPWWLLNTVAGKTEFQPSLINLYDRIGVPIARFIEGIVTPPFGKNILLIATKR